MKPILFLLFLLSAVYTALVLIPAANDLLWPAVTVAAELWPYFIALNVLGLLLSLFKWRLLALVFLLGLGVSSWPMLSVPSLNQSMAAQWDAQGFRQPVDEAPEIADLLESSFTDFYSPRMTPQTLNMGMAFYPPPPSSNTLAPIIIHIHGGAWQFGSAADNRAALSRLANQGYAVFSVAYRFAPQFTFPAQLEDVQSALTWIHDNANSYQADSSRIALIGRSAGAQLAMLAAYTSEIPVRGVVSYYGPTELAAMYEDPPVHDPMDIRDKLVDLLGGTPADIPELYAQASPTSSLRNRLPPTLQITGARDIIVKARFPREWHETLVNYGESSLLLEIPWSFHAFDAVYFAPGNQLAKFHLDRFLNEVMN
ncbi:MAG: alpha/beta hydrolase [Pseudohongiellaceae bacterium]